MLPGANPLTWTWANDTLGQILLSAFQLAAAVWLNLVLRAQLQNSQGLFIGLNKNFLPNLNYFKSPLLRRRQPLLPTYQEGFTSASSLVRSFGSPGSGLTVLQRLHAVGPGPYSHSLYVTVSKGVCFQRSYCLIFAKERALPTFLSCALRILKVERFASFSDE